MFFNFNLAEYYLGKKKFRTVKIKLKALYQPFKTALKGKRGKASERRITEMLFKKHFT